MLKEKFAQYKEQLLDNMFNAFTQNILTISTFVACVLTITKYFYPEHYNSAIELTTFWLAVKKGH